jgi:two-component system, OmpR family, response regulator
MRAQIVQGDGNVDRVAPMNPTELKTLLYVDDDRDIREVVKLALGLIESFTVHVCASGEEALKLIPIIKPELVLLDVMMPGMDGPSVLSCMKADTQQPHRPVIFVTAKALPREIAHFCELGAVGVIAKPFDPMQLGRQVLQMWEALKQEPQMV